MASFNKVILMGNLTRDPELKTAPSGSKVADLGLAVSENWRDKNTGENREVVCFVDVTVWNRLAELCHQYLRKGSPVLVEGRLQMDEWKNPQGEKRSKLRVRADTVKFVGPSPKRDAQDAKSDGSQRFKTGASAQHQSSGVDDESAVGEPPSDVLQDDDEHLPF
ncbi:MAG: single-stranded DNA-binding protein [Kiritimatiellae bacterium]|nr:single-stranded DNA-binding protein [Kiritimatiellia bacterium]